MRVLVVGGAGYIGSHMVKMLVSAGHDVTVLDDLSSGYRDAVLTDKFVAGDLADSSLLREVFGRSQFDGVMHFASSIQVGESVTDPAKYYRNNVINTLNLLDVMLEFNVRRLIFSSTAAVFGEPRQESLDEEHPKHPVNPYGQSKLMVEQVLADYARAYDFRSICLRYFNAAGADPGGELGERHEPETHLIPLVLQAASGRRDSITVFGSDYDTPDGTCVRDYIHVSDLCDAHLLALQLLWNGDPGGAYNLGNGNGFSVREVIETVQQVSGRPVAVIQAPRRDGDPARLIADSTLARAQLGWSPRFADLRTIVEHAWH